MTRASSVRELKTELPDGHVLQVSMSMASRLVSTMMLSMVQWSTAVPRTAKWPPFLRRKSRKTMLLEFFEADGLVAGAGHAGGVAGWARGVAADEYVDD
jgi:hypothetical protein